MPVVYIPLLGEERAVTHEIVKQTTKQLIEKINLPGDMTVKYLGELETEIVRNNNILNGDRKTANTDSVQVRFEDKILESQTAASSIFTSGNTPLFNEDDLGFRVVTMYRTYELRLTLRIVFESRSEMLRWRSHRGAVDRDLNITIPIDAKFAYTIPKELKIFISHLYELNNPEGSVTETGDEFVTRIVTDTHSYRFSSDGVNKNIVFPEIHKELRGYFSDAFYFNQAKTELTTNALEAEFVLEYPKPTHVAVVYPLIVNNQLISKGFRDRWLTKAEPTPETINLLSPLVSNINRIDHAGTVRYMKGDTYVPSYLKSTDYHYFSAPSLVSDADPRFVVSMTTIEGMLPTSMIAFFRANKDLMFSYDQSPYVISLHRLTASGEVRCALVYDALSDSILTEVDRDATKRYYLDVVCMRNLGLMDKGSIAKICASLENFINAFYFLYPDLADNLPDFIKVLNNGMVTESSFYKMLTYIQQTHRAMKLSKLGNSANVSVNNIIARKS